MCLVVIVLCRTEMELFDLMEHNINFTLKTTLKIFGCIIQEEWANILISCQWAN